MLYGNILYHFQAGYFTLLSDNHYIRKILFGKHELGEDAVLAPEHPLLQEAARQLNEYFDGKRQTFALPVCPDGTDFQKSVWNVLQQIPYGETWSYAQMAAFIGRPKAARAVGNACNKNPIVIVNPCHRIIGADGTLTGFGGGLALKQWLLELEAAHNPIK